MLYEAKLKIRKWPETEAAFGNIVAPQSKRR